MLTPLRLVQRGVSLLELILFIVIIGVALAGILLVTNTVTARSADTLIRKQAVAIAESFLEEIELQDFSNPVGGFTGASTQANRGSFDDVMDYNGFSTAGAGIYTLSGTAITGLESYNLSVGVVGSALGSLSSTSSVLITVTVTDPQNNSVQAIGYRTAY